MFNIQSRRFLGNKYKLLSFIEQVISQECPNAKSLLDIFSGTGVVAYHFAPKMKVITSDILYSNYLSNIAFLSKDDIDEKKLTDFIDKFNSLDTNSLSDNYMSNTFKDTYFSYQDCKKIGYIREEIENSYNHGKINFREKAILITALIYSMDKIANTVGHYDAYRKNVAFTHSLNINMLNLQQKAMYCNEFYCGDSNQIKFPTVDIVYCDPPYNSRNYCDLYHVLENVARWEKPTVTGVAKKFDRTLLKSNYCSRNAAKAFEELVNKLDCKYIVLSYNNTGTTANDRSNARMTDEDITRILSAKGELKVFSQKHKAFTTGKSDNTTNAERLFVCKVKKQNTCLIKSPLNYTGGKYRILSQILPLFPKHIDTFIDLFSGGANVGINVQANKVIYNDNFTVLNGLIETITDPKFEQRVDSIIKQYSLSNSSVHGYKFYNCNSSNGLGSYNKPHYEKLRSDFNKLKDRDVNYYTQLYVLTVFSFNNQIRFNSRGEFNLPVGKRDFNNNLRFNVREFAKKLKQQNYELTNFDFRMFPTESLTKKSFVYCDPPYLITTASYNEQYGWTSDDDKALMDFLDSLNKKEVRFALNNVFKHKGKTNTALIEWSEKYNVHIINHDYNNSSYHGKNTKEETIEVLITNY